MDKLEISGKMYFFLYRLNGCLLTLTLVHRDQDQSAWIFRELQIYFYVFLLTFESKYQMMNVIVAQAFISWQV